MSGSAPRHRIVCCGKAFASQLTELQDRLGQDFAIETMPSDMNPTDMRDRLDGALAVIAMALPAGLRLPQGIRLVQVPAAGWETLCPEQVPAGIPICTVGGHEIAVAEYCVTQTLAWRHRLREAEEDFRSGSWGRSGRLGAAPHGELHGSTTGIIGYGAIGRALARLLHAFGVNILVANRSPVAIDAVVGGAFGLDALPHMLAQCDFGVVCLGETPETSGLVGAEALAALGPGGVIVNVGRGPVIEEAALYHALAENRLGGAILDVWYRYPDPGDWTDTAPSRFDFAALPNVMMTPHISGWTEGTANRRLHAIADNIRRAAGGTGVTNIVALGRLEK